MWKKCTVLLSFRRGLQPAWNWENCVTNDLRVLKLLSERVCIQPSINNEEATVSFTITAVTTNIAVSMLLATNCCTNKKKNPTRSQRRSPTASAHLVICLFLSLHFRFFSSIRLSSFLRPFSLIHHFLNHSCPLPAYIPSPPPHPPWYHQHFLHRFAFLFGAFLS